MAWTPEDQARYEAQLREIRERDYKRATGTGKPALPECVHCGIPADSYEKCRGCKRPVCRLCFRVNKFVRWKECK